MIKKNIEIATISKSIISRVLNMVQKKHKKLTKILKKLQK